MESVRGADIFGMSNVATRSCQIAQWGAKWVGELTNQSYFMLYALRCMLRKRFSVVMDIAKALNPKRISRNIYIWSAGGKAGSFNRETNAVKYLPRIHPIPWDSNYWSHIIPSEKLCGEAGAMFVEKLPVHSSFVDSRRPNHNPQNARKYFVLCNKSEKIFCGRRLKNGTIVNKIHCSASSTNIDKIFGNSRGQAAPFQCTHLFRSADGKWPSEEKDTKTWIFANKSCIFALHAACCLLLWN